MRFLLRSRQYVESKRSSQERLGARVITQGSRGGKVQVQEQIKNQLTITKQCVKCSNVLPLSEFTKRKHGKYDRHSICNRCRSKNPEKYKQLPEYQMQNGVKKCSTCKIVKPVSEFHKSAGCPDGYNYKCKICRIGHNIGRDIYIIKYDEAEIIELYINQERSTTWIGRKLGVSHKTVVKWLGQIGIQQRDAKEQMRISAKQYAKYDRALREMVRFSYNGNAWKKRVLERDNYQCQHCDSFKKICVHHIKDMYTLLKEFLLLYPQYDVDKDKLLLVELSQLYKPLWDESNGIALCWDCHCKEHNFDFSSKARPHQNRKNPNIKYVPCELCGVPKRWNGYDKDPVTDQRETICATCKYSVKNGLKICRKCKIKHSVSCYTKNTKESDHLNQYCRMCEKIAKDERLKVQPKKQPNSICQECGSGFYVSLSRKKGGRGKFCSKECMYKRSHIILNCKNCQKDFERNKSAIRKYKEHFCCSKCMYDYKKGGKV